MCYAYSALVYFPYKTDYLSEFVQHGLNHLSEAFETQGLGRNPIEDGAISGFSGQKSVPE